MTQKSLEANHIDKNATCDRFHSLLKLVKRYILSRPWFFYFDTLRKLKSRRGLIPPGSVIVSIARIHSEPVIFVPVVGSCFRISACKSVCGFLGPELVFKFGQLGLIFGIVDLRAEFFNFPCLTINSSFETWQKQWLLNIEPKCHLIQNGSFRWFLVVHAEKVGHERVDQNGHLQTGFQVHQLVHDCNSRVH